MGQPGRSRRTRATISKRIPGGTDQASGISAKGNSARLPPPQYHLITSVCRRRSCPHVIIQQSLLSQTLRERMVGSQQTSVGGTVGELGVDLGGGGNGPASHLLLSSSTRSGHQQAEGRARDQTETRRRHTRRRRRSDRHRKRRGRIWVDLLQTPPHHSRITPKNTAGTGVSIRDVFARAGTGCQEAYR
jgi:hypothetical protein